MVTGEEVGTDVEGVDRRSQAIRAGASQRGPEDAAIRREIKPAKQAVAAKETQMRGGKAKGEEKYGSVIAEEKLKR